MSVLDKLTASAFVELTRNASDGMLGVVETEVTRALAAMLLSAVLGQQSIVILVEQPTASQVASALEKLGYKTKVGKLEVLATIAIDW